MTAFPEPPEIEIVTTRRVACDGGVGALGHPRVWLSLGEDGEVECPYCDKLFRLAGKDTGAGGAAA